MTARRKPVRRQPPWRRFWRVFPFLSITVDARENPDTPVKGMLWVRVGDSMRNVRLWDDPMAEVYVTDDKEIVEFVKFQ
jgi:hypothetical protein